LQVQRGRALGWRARRFTPATPIEAVGGRQESGDPSARWRFRRGSALGWRAPRFTPATPIDALAEGHQKENAVPHSGHGVILASAKKTQFNLI
jgi:hypothetical protein